MNRFILITLGILAYSLTYAQDCQPDETVPDSVVVSPLPHHPDTNPDGGIPDTACVGGYYELVFTFNVPEIYEFSGIPLPINSVDVAPNNGINNLPASMSYVCNPPNCQFQANEKGCLVIYGTPTAEDEGVHDLTISVTIRSAIDIPLTLPGDLQEGATYTLHVREPGFENCLVGTQQQFASEFGLRNQPNPFGSFTQVVVDAQRSGNYIFFVTDLLGRRLHEQPVNLFEGENTLDFDGSQLPDGLYLYGITNGRAYATGKMVVKR